MDLQILNVRKGPTGPMFRVSTGPMARLNHVVLEGLGNPEWIRLQWDEKEKELVFMPSSEGEIGVLRRTKLGCIDIYRRGLEEALGAKIKTAEYEVRVTDGSARVQVEFLNTVGDQNG